MRDIRLKLDVWVQVMANINGKYAQEIAKDINTTYSYVHKIIKNLEDMNLIQSKKIGRTVFFYHTEKGKEIGNSCKNLVNFIRRREQNQRTLTRQRI